MLAQNLAVHPGSSRGGSSDKETSMEPEQKYYVRPSFQSDVVKHQYDNLWVLLDMKIKNDLPSIERELRMITVVTHSLSWRVEATV